MLIRPTFTELLEQTERDFDARIPGGDSRLRRSVLSVLARVHARALHYLYGGLDWLARQILPDTADAEYLDRHSVLWGVPRKAAVFAGGDVTLTGLNGSTAPAGTLLARSDGVQLQTLAEATISAGSATVAASALLAGATANTAAASTLTFVSPISGIDGTATVAAGGITGGEDQEDDESLRARVVQRISNPPQAGAAHDYVRWALEVAGVTRAWATPGVLAGTVDVVFVRDGDSPIIPDAGELAAVAAYIEERRPVTADVNVLAPTAVPLDFTIHVDPDTASVRAAVEAELVDLLAREGSPGGTLRLSRIREAISRAAGESFHTMTVPAADVTLTGLQLSTLGTITWV